MQNNGFLIKKNVYTSMQGADGRYYGTTFFSNPLVIRFSD